MPDDCCEYPICLLITDVNITEEAALKLSTILCNGGEIELFEICHNGQTLSLPAVAAMKHLQEHPGDTVGPCPDAEPVPEPETIPEPAVEPEPTV